MLERTEINIPVKIIKPNTEIVKANHRSDRGISLIVPGSTNKVSTRRYKLFSSSPQHEVEAVLKSDRYAIRKKVHDARMVSAINQ